MMKKKIVTRKAEGGKEKTMTVPDKTRIIINGETDVGATIVREEAVIMATTTTRGDGLARRTARKKTMEGGGDTATQQLH
jgi:hypothetical protein